MAELRKERDPETGTLPIESLCRVAALLDLDQMRDLTHKFPVIYRAASLHDTLALLDRQPLLLKRLRSPEGIPLREALPLLRPIGDWPPDELMASGRAVTVRLDSTRNENGLLTGLRLLAADGTALTARTFLDPGYAPGEKAGMEGK